jgi:RimJ/RimL family protein N-acetyltransferase
VDLPTLEGQGLVLRAMRPGDADALVAACQDPEIPRWTLVPSPYTRAHAEQYLARAAEQARAGTAANLLGFDSAGALVGSFSLMEIDRRRGVAEIGYWTAAPARGRGLTTRAVGLLRAWGEEELGLRTLEILCDEANAPSRRVAERAGFTETGERRAHPRADDPGPPRHVVYRRRAG